jgi:hypothetical protein
MTTEMNGPFCWGLEISVGCIWYQEKPTPHE